MIKTNENTVAAAKSDAKMLREQEKRNKEIAKNNTKMLREQEKRNKEISKNNAKILREQEKRNKEISKNNAKIIRDAWKAWCKKKDQRKKYYDKFKKILNKCLRDVRKRSGNENDDDKTRKRCEHPCTELLCGMALCNANISIEKILNMTYEDIQQYPELNISNINFNCYIEDLKKRLLENKNEHSSLEKYILSFVEESSKVVCFGKIKKVFIVGKKNIFEEIDTLNAQVKDKKDAKGDIMIQLDDDKYIGLSVKSGKHATKSNYSIIKYFKDDVVNECQTIRAKYLTENGFPVFNKEDRPEVNKLFHDRFNPLFQKFREEVLKEDIGRKLVDSLYGVNLPYDIYEFDGNELVLLTNRNIDYGKVSFLECIEYYLKNNGIDRNAAKMFFKLQNGDVTYRVELRWKGVIHTAWPQFHIHSM